MRLYYNLVLIFDTTVKSRKITETHYMGMSYKTDFVSVNDYVVTNNMQLGNKGAKTKNYETFKIKHDNVSTKGSKNVGRIEAE